MAHFAHITNGIVDAVIVISRETLEQKNGWKLNGIHYPLNEWVQTSYNTIAGKYEKGATEQEKLSLKLAGNAEDIKARNRKHYASIGYSYDPDGDMFVPKQPYASWKLNKETAIWEAPKAYPKDGKPYDWNEQLLDWVIAE